MTIKEVSEKFNISADTLRYYERVGAIPPVTRTKTGIRDYRDSDLAWVQLAICLRAAGCSIDVLIKYVQLVKEGDSTASARLKLLSAQREELLEQRKQLDETIELLNYKISFYETSVETKPCGYGVNKTNKKSEVKDMKYQEKTEFDKVNIFGTGDENSAFAQYFVGNSFLNPLTNPSECPVFLANVTFEPGCRNNWHIHHATSGGGQILICTAGEGWYQEEGKAAVSLVPGTVIVIPPEVKHWHGAKSDTWFSHIAVEVPGENTSNEWCEPISDNEYENL